MTSNSHRVSERIADIAGESGVSRRTLLKLVGGSGGMTVLGVRPGTASDGPRHFQTQQPADLCNTVPGDHHLALIEDSSHERGRGFYSGGADGKWYFGGWLRQTRPSETATGSVKPDGGVSEPSHRLIQVWQPSDLRNYKPTDQHVAYIEDASHENGRGFYAGGRDRKWYFIGWLQQDETDSTAGGSVTPASGVSQPSNRLLQVEQPSDLQNYDPTDHHLALIEDESHERGRGFYSGGSDGEWYFIGWLAQSNPSGETTDTVDPDSSECGSESTCAVSTDSSSNVGADSATLNGTLDDLGGADSVDCYFGWREAGASSWNETPKQTLSSTGAYSHDTSGLSSGTDYEFRAVATASDGDADTGTTNAFTTATDNDGRAGGAWRWYADDIDAYESWLGDGIQVAANGHGKSKWRYFVPYDTRDFPAWSAGGDNRVFLPHIPMVPREETDAVGRATALRNLAAGEYNDKFRTMAEGFHDDGFTPDTLILRIGSEFNIVAQPYSPVGTDVTPQTWIDGYRQIVDICRDVLGSDLRTVWVPLLGSTQMSSQQVLDHYPGSNYAMVGGHVYDNKPAYEKESKAPDGIDYDNASDADRKKVQEHVWEENHLKGNKWGNDGAGLNDIARLSADVGRPISIPEWALTFDDYEWGGDVNPVFVQNMYDWMTEHDVLFHTYFEIDTWNGEIHTLSNEDGFDFAEAETRYQQTFGGL